ncbi:hypothetical protein AB7M35_004115 [Amorphus suaedae]
MIAAAMAAAALAGRIPWKVCAATALLLAGWWAVDRAYDRGRADCAAAASRAIAAERMRQALANAEALRAGAEIATALADENDRLKSLVAEIADESRDLPDGGACGIDPDRLRLLDRIGGEAEPRGAAGEPHP